MKSFQIKKSSAPGSQNSEAIVSKKSHALRGELTWTHYRLLMKVENEVAWDYYMEEAITQNRSTRALERQINSFYYERIISSKNKKGVIEEAKKETNKLALSPEDFIKDLYIVYSDPS